MFDKPDPRSATANTTPLARFVNHPMFSYAVAGMSLLYILTFPIGKQYEGRSVLAYLIFAPGYLVFSILHVFFADIIFIVIPVVVVSIKRKIHHRVVFAFILLVSSYLLSAIPYFRIFIQHLGHSDAVYRDSSGFGLRIQRAYTVPSYLRYVAGTAWEYVNIHLFSRSYPFVHEELEKYQPRLNVSILASLGGLVIMLVGAFRKKPKSSGI